VGLLLGIILVSSGGSVVVLRGVADGLRRYSHELEFQQDCFADVAFRLRSFEADFQRHRNDRDFDAVEIDRRHFPDMRKVLDELQNSSLSQQDKETVETLAREERRIRTLLYAFAASIDYVKDDNGQAIQSQIDQAIADSISRSVQCSDDSRAAVETAGEDMITVATRTSWMLIGGAIATVVASIVISVLLTRTLTRGVVTIRKATDELAGETSATGSRIPSPMKWGWYVGVSTGWPSG